MFDWEKIRIVVVDDEQYICNIIFESLAGCDYEVTTFTDPIRAIKHIESNPVDLVLTDLVMGEHSGVQVVETVLGNHSDAIVILMTAHPTVQTAISVLKRGAYDFLVKPFKLELLRATIKRGLSHQSVVRDNLQLRGQVAFMKVANAATPDMELDDYLQMVLKSCVTELSARGAAFIGINPETGEVNRILRECPDSELVSELTAPGSLDRFVQQPQEKPWIRSSEMQEGGREVSKIYIDQPVIAGTTLFGVIRIAIMARSPRVNRGQLDALTILANSAAAAIASHKLYEQRQESYLEAIRGLANAVEARDPLTAGHTDRVTRMAELVARQMGWTDEQLENLVMGCTLHDIGKIGVPDSILSKPGVLTEEERQRMIEHPSLGMKIVQGIKLFEPAIPYILDHHEKFDGSGYPAGKKGDEISIEGRLLAVIDTFDAIMSNRPYRDGAELKTAVWELYNYSGTQFDPSLVQLFFDLLRSGQVDLNDLYDRSENLDCMDEIPALKMVPV